MPIADFRSDTVTRPSTAMKEAMFSAPLGDDVFGDDPTVNALEAYAAELFAKEAALFCPSGTMTNQIAISVYTRPGDEVVCHSESHIYRYEGGGIARNAGASVRLIDGNRGRIKPGQVATAINNPDDVHQPLTTLVALEDTSNRGGGAIYDYADIEAIAAVCKANGLPLHLDGARLFNALVETGMAPADYGPACDSISICLSKGLGAPVGSLLLGKADFIRRARRVRKVFGGGMRQAGVLAAAGLYALQHNVQRLGEDHRRARELAKVLSERPWVSQILPVETNIVICDLAEPDRQAEIVAGLEAQGVRSIPFGAASIRFITHLDIDDSLLAHACDVIAVS